VTEIQQTKKRSRRRRSRTETRDDSPFSKYILFLLAAIPVISTLVYGAVDIWAVGLLSIAAAVLFALWTGDGLKARSFRFSGSKLQIPILGLISIAVVQLLPIGNAGLSPGLLNIPAASALSMDAYATRFFLLRLAIAFIFFAAALVFINSQKRLRRMALMIVIFGAVMAFAGILQRLASPDAIYGMRPTPQAIPFGPFVNQHHFAAFMEMTAGLTLGLLFGGGVKKDKTALLGICAVLMGIAVLMTGSRGGFLSMLGVIGFVLAARFFTGGSRSDAAAGPTSKLAAVVGSAAAVILIAGTTLYLGAGGPLLRGLGFSDQQTDITSGRSHFWSIALQIFSDHPIIGAGFDAFAAAFSKYDTWHGLYRVEQAHNDYLQMLADAGILGFACVAAFIFLLFRRGLKVISNATDDFRRSVAVGAMAGCFGILIHSFFDFPMRTQSNAFFFLLLVVLATVPLGDEMTDEER
jgi:O-antigen ligase